MPTSYGLKLLERHDCDAAWRLDVAFSSWCRRAASSHRRSLARSPHGGDTTRGLRSGLSVGVRGHCRVEARPPLAHGQHPQPLQAPQRARREVAKGLEGVCLGGVPPHGGRPSWQGRPHRGDASDRGPSTNTATAGAVADSRPPRGWRV